MGSNAYLDAFEASLGGLQAQYMLNETQRYTPPILPRGSTTANLNLLQQRAERYSQQLEHLRCVESVPKGSVDQSLRAWNVRLRQNFKEAYKSVATAARGGVDKGKVMDMLHPFFAALGDNAAALKVWVDDTNVEKRGNIIAFPNEKHLQHVSGDTQKMMARAEGWSKNKEETYRGGGAVRYWYQDEPDKRPYWSPPAALGGSTPCHCQKGEALSCKRNLQAFLDGRREATLENMF